VQHIDSGLAAPGSAFNAQAKTAACLKFEQTAVFLKHPG
jgi:hypothetical protein